MVVFALKTLLMLKEVQKSHLAKGIYLVKVGNEKDYQMKKIVVE